MRRALAATIAMGALALACSSVAPAPGGVRVEPTPQHVPEPAPTWPAPEAETPLAAPEATQLRVTATAYNSLPAQGVGRGTHGAWGDRLSPDMKTVAISHDLIALGLTRGMKVEIEGLEGLYTVMDRLPRRWTRRIDIYMGKDVRAAHRWGKREVRIRWLPSAAANAD